MPAAPFVPIHTALGAEKREPTQPPFGSIMTAGVPVCAEVKSPAAKADGKSVLVLPLSRKVTPEPLCTVTLSPYDAMGINTATIVGKITRIIMFFLSSEILLVHTNTTPRIGP